MVKTLVYGMMEGMESSEQCPLCETPPGWHAAGCPALQNHPSGPFPDYGERQSAESVVPEDLVLAVQTAIVHSTDATDGSVKTFLEVLRREGYEVRPIDQHADSVPQDRVCLRCLKRWVAGRPWSIYLCRRCLLKGAVRNDG